MDHYILLLIYLSNHLDFITNGFKRLSKTNSTVFLGHSKFPLVIRGTMRKMLICTGTLQRRVPQQKHRDAIAVGDMGYFKACILHRLPPT